MFSAPWNPFNLAADIGKDCIFHECVAAHLGANQTKAMQNNTIKNPYLIMFIYHNMTRTKIQ